MTDKKEKESRYIVESGFYLAVPTPVTLDTGKTYVQLGLSGKSGTKQALVMMKLKDHNVTLPWYGYFTPDAIERTVESLRLLGFKGKSFEEMIEAELTSEVSVTVETDKFKGKVRSRVAWINDPSGPGIKMADTFDAKGLKGLDKEFGSYLKS